MVSKKRSSYTHLLPVALFAFTGMVSIAHAQKASNPAPTPLHIKISPSSNKLSSDTLNIISGPIPRSTISVAEQQNAAPIEPIKAEHEEPENTTRPKQKPKRIVTDQIEQSNEILCDKNQTIDAMQAALSGAPFEHAGKDKKLADSLRAYMNAHDHDPAMIDAIYYASQETGASFELLIIKAMLESDLGEHTIAPNSSARGIFQYIDSTWLALIKQHGEHIGYKPYADALEMDIVKNQFNVTEDSSFSRNDILKLRYNSRITALIKSYQILDEQKTLHNYKNNQTVHITDHYIVHMMGLPLAKMFYKLQQSESAIIPASLTNRMFEKAIASNKNFFYDDDGNGLNAMQIYSKFEQRSKNQIKALHEIDNLYGSGENVKAPPCMIQETNADFNIKTVSSTYTDTTPYISSDALLSQEPINLKRLSIK